MIQELRDWTGKMTIEEQKELRKCVSYEEYYVGKVHRLEKENEILRKQVAELEAKLNEKR